MGPDIVRPGAVDEGAKHLKGLLDTIFEGPQREMSRQERYLAQLEGRQLSPVSGIWVKFDGAVILSIDDGKLEERRMIDPYDENLDDARVSQVGKYNCQAGCVVRVDETGALYIRPTKSDEFDPDGVAHAALIQELLKAGYQEDPNMPVCKLLAPDRFLQDSKLQAQWEQALTENGRTVHPRPPIPEEKYPMPS